MTEFDALRVVLAGGGSAGHVSPMLALADTLRARNPNSIIVCLGTQEGLEATLVPQHGYELSVVPKVPLPRRLSADLLRLPIKLRSAISAASETMESIDAQVVVGMGGYVSVPAYFGARAHGIPIVIHEQNTRPGVANKLGARMTRYVATSFPSTELPHAQHIGLPLRPQIARYDRNALRSEALDLFGLNPGRRTLLVTGGSLGAQKINEVMTATAEDFRNMGVQVVHLTGRGKSEGVPTHDEDPVYRVVEYCDRMDLAYAAADMVLCRSGANTVCEVTAVGLPAAFVPLPIGNGEQRLNAQPVVDAAGAVMVDDSALTPLWLRQNVLDTLANPDALAQMSRAASEFGDLGAADALADMVYNAAENQ